MKATYPTLLPNTTRLALLSCCCLLCPCERLTPLFSVYFGSMVLTHQAVIRDLHLCKRLPVRGQCYRTPTPSFLKISPASSIFLLSGPPIPFLPLVLWNWCLSILDSNPGSLPHWTRWATEPSLARLTSLRWQCREESLPRSVTVSAPTALLCAGRLLCCWGYMVNLLSTLRSWNGEVSR